MVFGCEVDAKDWTVVGEELAQLVRFHVWREAAEVDEAEAPQQ